MILDTTVLVDLQKELRREQPAAACRLLEAAGDVPVFITFVTWMEFAEGFGDDAREACGRFLAGFKVLWPDVDTAWIASRDPSGRPAGRSATTTCGSPHSGSSTAGPSSHATSSTSGEWRGCPSGRTDWPSTRP